MIDQPILTRWENISKSFLKHLFKRVDFIRLCYTICNMYNADKNKNKIVPDHVFLAKKELLITQTYFLLDYYDFYWDKYYKILKKPSDITCH